MIIYYTVTSYHILKSALHKLIYHKEEQAVILIPSFLVKMPYGFVNKEANDIFDKVIIYGWETETYSNSPKDVFADIKKTLEKELGENWFCETEEINVFQASYYFGSFLATEKIRFNWFEDADGRFSDPCHVMEIDKRIAPERFMLAEKLGLYNGENVWINKKYISFKNQKQGIDKNYFMDFDTNEALSKVDIVPLLKLFGVHSDKINIPSKSVLVLSQHFCNLGIMSEESQVDMYRQLVDYYLSGYQVFIKVHPSDKVKYDKYIQNITILDADYPSELLKYVCNRKFALAITVSSTGIDNAEEIADRQIKLNDEYVCTFVDHDLYYFVCHVIKTFPNHKVVAMGINIQQLQVMLDIEFHMPNVKISGNWTIGDTDKTIFVLNRNTGQEIIDKVIHQPKSNNVVILFDIDILSREVCSKKITLLTKVIKKANIVKPRSRSVKYVKIIADIKNVKKVKRIKYEKLLPNLGVKIKVSWNLIEKFKYRYHRILDTIRK